MTGAGWEDTGRDRCRDTGGQADTLVGDLPSTVLGGCESREESDDVEMKESGQMGMTVGRVTMDARYDGRRQECCPLDTVHTHVCIYSLENLH